MKRADVLSKLIAILLCTTIFAGCSYVTTPKKTQTEEQTEEMTEEQTEEMTEEQTEEITEEQTEEITEEQTEEITEEQTETEKQLTLDKKTAAALDTRIAALGEITLDKSETVASLMADYNALTPSQKIFVTNYALLMSASETLAELNSTPQKPASYTVKPGDSLGKIAAFYGATLLQVVSANNIENPDLIYSGQVLAIPLGAGNPLPSTVKYTVKSGDTLSKIAAQYGIDFQEIAFVNSINDPGLIYEGQVLTIPVYASEKISDPILVSVTGIDRALKILSYDKLGEIYETEDGYAIRNESAKIRSMLVADNASIYILDGGSTHLVPTDFAGLYAHLESNPRLYKLEINGDYIINIVQQYMP